MKQLVGQTFTHLLVPRRNEEPLQIIRMTFIMTETRYEFNPTERHMTEMLDTSTVEFYIDNNHIPNLIEFLKTAYQAPEGRTDEDNGKQ